MFCFCCEVLNSFIFVRIRLGSRKPGARKAFGDVDVEDLKEKFEAYTRKAGVKAAFKLFSYTSLDIPNAADGASLFKLNDLLWAMLKVAPQAEVKYNQLRFAR